MRQNTIILFSVALLALLCSQTKALPFFGGNSLRNTIINARATSSGVIDLKKDESSSGTFYVEADLSSSYSSSNSSNSSNSTNSTGALGVTDTVRMMVSIANEETMVASSCLNFNYYDCSKYNCNKYSYTKTIDFPTFTANVQYARSYVYLDYNYWGLNSAYLYIAQSCSSGASSAISVGYGRYGVLGLGTGNGASSDFTSGAIFSIFVNSGLNGGKLLFKKDTSNYAKSSTPLHTFYANSTWQIPTYGASIQLPGYSIYMGSNNIMFDVNSDAIGLPYNSYSLFFTYFGYTNNVWCSSGTYRPYCYTTLSLDELPDVTLSFNNHQLTIPSQIYATYSSESGSYKYFYLNFKATGPSLLGKNYVTPSFANSIILDANFLSYYYTVFDASSGSSNAIYLYPSTNSPYSEPSLTKWIALGAAAALFLVSICCCCCKKNRKTITTGPTMAPINTTTDAFNTTQAPLVYNQQPINTVAPNYSYDPSPYNYAGYNYPPQPQGVYQAYQQPQGGMFGPGYVAPAPTGDFQERAKQ